MNFEPTPEQLQYQLAHPNQSRVSHIISSTTILLVVAYAGVVLRGLARRKAKLRFEADDVLIALALVCLTAFAIILYVCIDYGFGKHIIWASNLKGLVISYVFETLFYCLATVFAKASILQLYCRIFRSKRLFRLSIILITFVVMYCLASFLVTAFMCIPISAIWRLEPDKCINPRAPLMVLGIVNVLTGFAILAIPIRFVLRLNMTPYRKFQVICVFLTGLLTCAFGIVRVVVFATAGEDDLSYNLTWPAVWAFAETAIGIVAACMPTMGIFFAKTYKMPLTPPPRITRGSVVAAYRTARGSLSKTLSRQIRPPHGSDRSLLVQDNDDQNNHEKTVPPIPIIYQSSTPSTSNLTTNSLSSFQISFPSPVAMPAPSPMADPFPSPGTVVQPQFFLDVSIPSHSLTRSSGNTDNSLGHFLSLSRGNSVRSEHGESGWL